MPHFALGKRGREGGESPPDYIPVYDISSQHRTRKTNENFVRAGLRIRLLVPFVSCGNDKPGRARWKGAKFSRPCRM